MNDSGLTDNGWVKRVGELRQMLADGNVETAEEVEWYIENVWEIEYDDEKAFIRQEFARQREQQ